MAEHLISDQISKRKIFRPRKMNPVDDAKIGLLFMFPHVSWQFSPLRSIRIDGTDELRCCTINPLSLLLKILG